MSSKQRYALQLEKLRLFLAYLRQFDEETQKQANNYLAKIMVLMEQGLPVEIGEKFKNDLCRQSKTLSDRNSAVIKEQAIPFVVRNIQGLEQLESKNGVAAQGSTKTAINIDPIEEEKRRKKEAEEILGQDEASKWEKELKDG